MLLVSMSWVEFIMGLIWSGEDGAAMGDTGKILKIIRMARILRIFRLVRFLVKIRIMVEMITGSLMHLFWLFLLLIAIIYAFAIILTQGATIEMNRLQGSSPDDEKRAAIEKYFGSIPETMYTLFKSMLGGENWYHPADVTVQIGAGYFVVFIFFVFFVLLSVLNIVTGVFVDSAMQQANKDRTSFIQKETEARLEVSDHLSSLLEQVDLDGNGFLTIDEWRVGLENHNITDALYALGVPLAECENLWHMIDADGDGIVDIKEFVFGMTRMRGWAKSADMVILLHGVQQILKILHDAHPHMRPDRLATHDMWLADQAGNTTSAS